jgi:ribosomal protein S18 acetylase RimI-like enzyme
VDVSAVVAAGTDRLGIEAAGELLTLQLAAWVVEGRLAGSFEIPPLLDTVADVAQALTDPTQTIWGYREGPRLIATVRTSALDPTTAYVGRLGVVPDRTREGIGSAILQLAEARLHPAIRRIELVTGINNLANHAFYARHGYAIVAADREQGIVRLAKEL